MAIRVKLLLFGLWASCLSCLHEFVRSQLCIVHYALCIVHCALKNCSSVIIFPVAKPYSSFLTPNF